MTKKWEDCPPQDIVDRVAFHLDQLDRLESQFQAAKAFHLGQLEILAKAARAQKIQPPSCTAPSKTEIAQL